LTEGEITVIPFVNRRRRGADTANAMRMQGRGIGVGLPHAITTLGYELEFAMRANLMFRSHNCLGEVAPPGRYFYCLVDGGGNTDNANAFGEWDKFT